MLVFVTRTTINPNHSKCTEDIEAALTNDLEIIDRYFQENDLVINLGKDVLPLVKWLIGYVDRMSKIRMSSG